MKRWSMFYMRAGSSRKQWVGMGTKTVWSIIRSISKFLTMLGTLVLYPRQRCELMVIIGTDATFLHRASSHVSTVMITVIHRHGVKGDGFLQESLIAPSSEYESSDGDYYDNTCNTCQSKNHARQGLVLEEGLVDGPNTLSGRG
jgi:hypothetical protein